MKSELHKPVMLKEVLENLDVKDGGIYLDCTFGAGGYSMAILQKANCQVIAFDRDEVAEEIAKNFKDEFDDRFDFVRSAFSHISKKLPELGISEIDGVVFDLGVSSMQLDDYSRGFSFDGNSRLDMRMDKQQEIDAYWVVNNLAENQLAQIIYEFGDEPKSRSIARKIVKMREEKPIETCEELANIIRFFYPKNRRTDPATKTFQAIRIFVNQELEELKIALAATKEILKTNGRLVVVSFHSLEDRIVKNFLKFESGIKPGNSRYQLDLDEKITQETFKLPINKAIIPSLQEITENNRARSAKLRFAIKN